MGRARSFIEVFERELWEIIRLRRLRQPPPPAPTEPDPLPSPPQTKKFCSSASQAPAETSSQDSPSDQAHARDVLRAAYSSQLSGLAFSGGGIRSATFNLGILQGLAEANLLRRADYLSTVSGGGYAGSWLTAWIYRHGFATVQDGLKPDRTQRLGDGQLHEEPEVRFLREYSNYLTPRLGLLGPDTWTAVSIYLRNLLLNQAVLILFFICILLLPRVLVYLTALVSSLGAPAWLALAAALFLGLCAIVSTQFNMAYFQERPQSGRQSIFTNMDDSSPTHLDLLNSPDSADEGRWKLQDRDHIEVWSPFFGHRISPLGGFQVCVDQTKPLGSPSRITLADPRAATSTLAILDVVTRVNVYPPEAAFRYIFPSVILPLVAASWLAAFWMSSPGSFALLPWWKWTLAGGALYALMWLFAILLRRIFHPAGRFPGSHSNPRRAGQLLTAFINTLSALLSGALGGLLFWLLTSRFNLWWGDAREAPWRVATLGVAMVIAIVLLTAVLHVGLRGIFFHDERREWWARASAYILIFGIFWLIVASIAFYSPLGVAQFAGRVKIAGIGWILSTLLGVLGAKSSKIGPLTPRSWKDALLSVTPWIFISGYLVLIAYYLQFALARSIAIGPSVSSSLSRFYGHAGLTDFSASHWLLMDSIQNWRLPVFLALCAAACALLAWRVDINEFAMHLFYRNRLVRAYLGASHRERSPHPFTGFDADDDIPLKNLSSIHRYDGPYHIINAALNLVHGKDLAWQERKAESFIMSPLFCGFDSWLENLQSTAAPAPSLDPFAFRPTASFVYPGGGFYLGTAMSISGAAVSPNMGYASSPSLSFLLTMFNARLGFWAGNPRRRGSWRRPGPVFGLFALIAELLGQTDDESANVYLSDGGHFENLALYELVKRRCRLIIVCDAGQDSHYDFGDLGAAVRKIRSDMGIEINIQPAAIRPDPASGFSSSHCAVGDIRYSCADFGAQNGTLLYIKPTLTGDEPADVINYRIQHPSFPNDTTANQWFTESQFESYRRLGLHTMRSILSALPPEPSGLSIPALATEISTRFPGI